MREKEGGKGRGKAGKEKRGFVTGWEKKKRERERGFRKNVPFATCSRSPDGLGRANFCVVMSSRGGGLWRSGFFFFN